MTDLGTVAGLAAAATGITGGLKRIFRFSGRYTQLVALIVAVVLSTVWNAMQGGVRPLEALLRGVLSGVTAIGVYEGGFYTPAKPQEGQT